MIVLVTVWANFWYITCFVHNLMPIWFRSHGLYSGLALAVEPMVDLITLNEINKIKSKNDIKKRNFLSLKH